MTTLQVVSAVEWPAGSSLLIRCRRTYREPGMPGRAWFVSQAVSSPAAAGWPITCTGVSVIDAVVIVARRARIGSPFFALTSPPGQRSVSSAGFTWTSTSKAAHWVPRRVGLRGAC
jgi:hypothetical protein